MTKNKKGQGRERAAHIHEKDWIIDKKGTSLMSEYHDACVNFSFLSLKTGFWISV